MYDVWNLDVIYKGFEDPAYTADLEALKAAVAEAGECAGKLAEMEPLEGLRRGTQLQEQIVQLDQDLWQADGSVLLEELSEKLDMQLESEEFDTLNGLVFHHLGTSPEVDEVVELEGLHITVTKTQNYQVETALLRKLPVMKPDEE